ncbi:MAG: 5-oxoprolinase subunit PxpB [Acidobacteria bacterium]|nr:5-oxoprolinase subunit PxpB [Acidobacteriota bacterium]
MTGNDYRIFPQGLDAVTIDFGNVISEELNRRVLALAASIGEPAFPGFIEAVPAFSSCTVFFDFMELRRTIPSGSTVFGFVSRYLAKTVEELTIRETETSRLIEIPVDFSPGSGPDLQFVADSGKLSTAETVGIFTSRTYRVFMLGFLPGFPYMGEIDERIASPRKLSPRTRVEKGSVGIAGRQTGIYPMASPGGWQIIGRTDFEMFTPDCASPTSLRAGDRVRFIAA